MELDAKDMLGVLMDRYSSQILMGTSDKAKGIRELSREFEIPLSVCYRRVKMLASIGLLKEEKNGKRIKYISNIEHFKAVLDFEGNRVKIEMNYEEGSYEMEGEIL
ncbi:MAG: winged helix-turn-helix transcriptional regulator [Euryarchaeota archaeon]|nr:winged helix-turn-helix transcriptional regulator [Euryarchaeota archaeon]